MFVGCLISAPTQGRSARTHQLCPSDHLRDTSIRSGSDNQCEWGRTVAIVAIALKTPVPEVNEAI